MYSASNYMHIMIFFFSMVCFCIISIIIIKVLLTMNNNSNYYMIYIYIYIRQGLLYLIWHLLISSKRLEKCTVFLRLHKSRAVLGLEKCTLFVLLRKSRAVLWFEGVHGICVFSWLVQFGHEPTWMRTHSTEYARRISYVQCMWSYSQYLSWSLPTRNLTHICWSYPAWVGASDAGFVWLW